MGCGEEKLSKYLTQTFIAHCNAMICQQVTLSGDAEWPKVADAVIEATCVIFRSLLLGGRLARRQKERKVGGAEPTDTSGHRSVLSGLPGSLSLPIKRVASWLPRAVKS